jgi:hypothetical protein
MAGVGLVNRAIGFDAQVKLLAPLARAKAGRAVIAGFGIDLCQNDHGRRRIGLKVETDPSAKVGHAAIEIAKTSIRRMADRGHDADLFGHPVAECPGLTKKEVAAEVQPVWIGAGGITIVNRAAEGAFNEKPLGDINRQCKLSIAKMRVPLGADGRTNQRPNRRQAVEDGEGPTDIGKSLDIDVKAGFRPVWLAVHDANAHFV